MVRRNIFDIGVVSKRLNLAGREGVVRRADNAELGLQPSASIQDTLVVQSGRIAILNDYIDGLACGGLD